MPPQLSPSAASSIPYLPPSPPSSSARLLYVSGDIGGTNSRLQLIETSASASHIGSSNDDSGVREKEMEVLIGEHVYPSKQHPSMSSILRMFLDKYNPDHRPIYCMSLVVAGPVSKNKAKITNLVWVIDGNALRDEFRMERVEIVNDFAGIGYGLLALNPKTDLEFVYKPPKGIDPEHDATGVKAVIGAGTGLGECFMTYSQAGGAHHVHATEGGHSDFSPRNQEEFNIMQHIKRTVNIERVSVERIVSGSGLPKIYEYLATQQPNLANPEVAARIKSGKEDVGALIGRYAESGKCPICVRTMDVFVSAYGAEAGNLCLKTLPYGGLYIAGGIAAKNMSLMRKNNQFVVNYLNKGRMKVELEKIPIYLIKHKDVGLLGARVLCRRFVRAGPGSQPVPPSAPGPVRTPHDHDQPIQSKL